MKQIQKLNALRKLVDKINWTIDQLRREQKQFKYQPRSKSI